jgi:hypothetical protein
MQMWMWSEEWRFEGLKNGGVEEFFLTANEH